MDIYTIFTSIGTFVGSLFAAWAIVQNSNKSTNANVTTAIKASAQAVEASAQVEQSNGNLSGEVNVLKGQIAILLKLLLEKNQDSDSVNIELDNAKKQILLAAGLAEQKYQESNARLQDLEKKLAMYQDRDSTKPFIPY